VATQTVYLNGRVLSSEVQTLEQAGVKDGEMLAVLIRQGQPQRQNPPANRNPGMGNTPSRRPHKTDPEMVRLHTLNNPAAQASLRDSSPTLFAALQDPARWREEFEKMQQQQDEAALEHQRQIAILNEDPFNVDAQRKIEEIIRQDRVQDNLQHAIDNTPEGELHAAGST
jgi:DNA damage-inducible protein 1